MALLLPKGSGNCREEAPAVKRSKASFCLGGGARDASSARRHPPASARAEGTAARSPHAPTNAGSCGQPGPRSPPLLAWHLRGEAAGSPTPTGLPAASLPHSLPPPAPAPSPPLPTPPSLPPAPDNGRKRRAAPSQPAPSPLPAAPRHGDPHRPPPSPLSNAVLLTPMGATHALPARVPMPSPLWIGINNMTDVYTKSYSYRCQPAQPGSRSWKGRGGENYK